MSDTKEIQPLREAKKPYARPQLVTYGDIREITAAFASTGNLDGMGFLKTGLN